MCTSFWRRPARRLAEPKDLDEILKTEFRGVVVDFWSAWCAQCRPLRRQLQRLADTRQQRRSLSQYLPRSSSRCDECAAPKKRRRCACAQTAALRFARLGTDPALSKAGIEPMLVAKVAEDLLTRFPNAALNSDEQRRFRAALYKPLLKLPGEERARVVDVISKVMLEAGP